MSDQIDLLTKSHRISLYNELGYVELVDMMPRLVPGGYTADLAIARNARVSYSLDESPSAANVERLVRYLSENWHTSPSESVVFQFRGRVPIYVSRHIDRHRTARSNYESGRYIQLPNDFYLPALRMQSVNNKQGSSDGAAPEEAVALWQECENDVRTIFAKYVKLVKLGVAKEVARSILPVGTMTTFMWQMDLHNLLHFLRLRMDEHAQQETREFANAIYQLILPIVPISVNAFTDFQLNQINLDSEEQRFMRQECQLNDRKTNQLEAKLNKVNIEMDDLKYIRGSKNIKKYVEADTSVE